MVVVVVGAFFFFFLNGGQTQLAAAALMTAEMAVTRDGEGGSGRAVLHNSVVLPSWESMPNSVQLVWLIENALFIS